jgi:hypothetical protein
MVPDIKVRSIGSRLTNERYISNLIADAFKIFKGQSGDSQLSKRRLDATRVSTASPSILGILEKDIMQIYVYAGANQLDDLSEFAPQSRLSIDQTALAACGMSLLNSNISSITSSITIWDPFVGSGQLLLAFASILNGIPPGSPAIDYPLRGFPFIGEDVFAKVANQIQITPHAIAKHVSFHGTDSSIEGISVSSTNLTKFMSQIPRFSDGSSPISTPIAFERIPDAFVPPTGTDPLYITSILPCGGDVDRRFKHFHLLLDRLGTRMIGCCIVTNKSYLFRKHSSRNWISELKFYDKRGRELELLRLDS